MAFSLKRRIYEGLPEAFKAPFAWVPFRFFAGPNYVKTIDRAHQFEHATRAEISAYQERELKALLQFACAQVPAYQSFRSLVERVAALDALKEFPFLDKLELQNNLFKYLPKDFSIIPHYECTTGGTTGNQLKFYLDDRSHAVELAFIHRMWGRVGYNTSKRKATFRGVDFKHISTDTFWQYNPIYREMQFSPFHMNEGSLASYFDALFRFKPDFIHGYPSAVLLITEYAVRNSINAAKLGLSGVLLGSEATLPDQRTLIERVFGCRAFSWYGHSERVLLGGECEKTPAYHQFPDYGVLEIITESGGAARPGESGELVGTGLLNRCLPLIRYRTEDRARRLESVCACGRNFDRFDQVEGRWRREYVIGKNGSRISTAALNMHGSMFDRIVRYQYFQDTPGKMELRVMVTPAFTESDKQLLHAAFMRKVGEELSIVVGIVDDIPLTARGKLRRLIQNIPVESTVEAPR